MEVNREDSGVCSRPPALDDLDLIAAIDGEAGGEVLEHLRDCPHCAERAREFDELQGLLQRRLYRILCPSSDDLVAYQQGWMELWQRDQIREHLISCPYCVGEIRLLTVAAEEPQPAALSGHPRRIIAQFCVTHPQSTLASLYGAPRSAVHGGQYAYRAENMELTLDVERAANRPDQLVLVGMLMDEVGSDSGPSSATASLLCDGVVLKSAALDNLGTFVLEDITPGNYSLALHLPHLEVVVETLSL